MGWNSWNHFRCKGLNQGVVLETADAMVASGMRDRGYQYLVIDDCWQDFTRTESGHLTSHPERFSMGMERIGQEIHDRGLKFGLYLSPGRQTCAMIYDKYGGRDIGSFGFEQRDADLLASWGVDYLKYDWCQADRGDTGLTTEQAFETMAHCLANTGRDMVYSISEYGQTKPWMWAGQYAHMSRTTADIAPYWWSIMRLANQQDGLAQYARPGQWNDPDMLQVGNGRLNAIDSRTHFMLWVMLAAPLMAGNDLRTMSAETTQLLTHDGLIAVSQDPAGRQGQRISRAGRIDVWRRELADGAVHGFLNRGPLATTLKVANGEVYGRRGGVLARLGTNPTNVWTGEELGQGDHRLVLAPHEMVPIRHG